MARTPVATDAFTGATLNANWHLLSSATAAISVDGLGHMVCSHSPQGVVAWTANTFTDDQYSKITVVFWAGSLDAEAVGVIIRASADEDPNTDYYQYFATDLGTSGTTARLFTLRKVINGTPTVLASGNVTCGDGSTIAIEVEGTALRGYVDDVLTHSASDAALTTGRPGATNNRAGAYTADDWEGGNIVAAAGGPAASRIATETPGLAVGSVRRM